MHKSHETRISDSSLYDEVCTKCGATDAAGDVRLDKPCGDEISANDYIVFLDKNGLTCYLLRVFLQRNLLSAAVDQIDADLRKLREQQIHLDILRAKIKSDMESSYEDNNILDDINNAGKESG